MLNLFYGLQHGRRKLGLLANTTLAFIIFFILYTATRSGSAQYYTKDVLQKLHGEQQPAFKGPAPTTRETLDLTHLEKHKLSKNFQYSRRIIHAKFVAEDRKSVTDIQQPLFTQSSMVPRSDSVNVERDADLPLALPVPVSQTTSGAQALSFGIATPLTRLVLSLPHLMHWLPNTGAMLHVICPVDPRTKNVTEHIRNLGININIVESNDRFPINYFSLLPLLYHTRLSSTKWLALIDDDTFFPDLAYLLAHLEAKYNPKLPQVISGVSDDIVQIKKHGLMPFGGGGIFLSVPFAAMIVDNSYPGTPGAVLGQPFPTPPNPAYSPFGAPIDRNETDASPEDEEYYSYLIDPNSPYRHSTAFKSCLASAKIEGDQILSDCINKQTRFRPQYDIDLHQLDVRGDASGFFETGRRSLTLHHWKSWFDVDMPSVASVTKICGTSCFLQRFRFPAVDSQLHPKEIWVLNNGFSITRYPNGTRGLSKDLPAPPLSPPVSHTSKAPIASITANPRFWRPSTRTWAEWPALFVGEEVVYEGVLGKIVEKEDSMDQYGVGQSKKDPFKGFGHMLWVPLKQPFPPETLSVPVISPATETSGHDESNKAPPPEPEWIPIIHPNEAHDDEASDHSSPNGEANTGTKEAPPDSGSKRLRRRETSSRSNWLPVTEEDIKVGSRVSQISEIFNPYTDHRSEAVHQAQEDELEDDRRFWSSIEKTWQGDADRYEHAMGPLRRELKLHEEVIRYVMIESVGGWGDPGRQDTEMTNETLTPYSLITGWPGDPNATPPVRPLNLTKLRLGDLGFEGLEGWYPPDPALSQLYSANKPSSASSMLPLVDPSPKPPVPAAAPDLGPLPPIPAADLESLPPIPAPDRDSLPPIIPAPNLDAPPPTPAPNLDASPPTPAPKPDPRPPMPAFNPAPPPPAPGAQTKATGPKLVPFHKSEPSGPAPPPRVPPSKAKRSWRSPFATDDRQRERGMPMPEDGEPQRGGMGGVDRPAVDWVRQTYVRKRRDPMLTWNGEVLDRNVKGELQEDEIIELVWIRR